MTVQPTARHAVNLFHLTMESQYGSDWRKVCSPSKVVMLADEIASGFGATAETPDHNTVGPNMPTIWRFPDDSVVRTGAFGLAEEEVAAEATEAA